MRKLAARTSKPEKYVREQISKRASRLGITSEAAQVLWAKEFRIGTARFHRSLPAHVQAQIHSALPSIFAKSVVRRPQKQRQRPTSSVKYRDSLRLAIEYLLTDQELSERCADLLRAHGNFDRVFREATTLLDDRLKTLGGIVNMNPSAVVGKVLNPDPKRAILVLSDDADEQEGFFNICKGLVLAFRNPTHHRLTGKFMREDALKFCGFVDILLAALKRARRNP